MTPHYAPLDAALALACKGLKVFPIRPGTKIPAVTDWPRRATTEEAQITRWWTRWPTANVGIHPEGLLVIDVDGPTAHANLQRLRLTRPLPDTVRINSGNTAEPHHYQLLYSLPAGVRGWNKPLAKFPGYEGYDKIDIKSGRGQVVGPGSVHHSGGTYAWAAEPVSLPEDATPAPEWAVAALCRPCEEEGEAEGKERPAVGSDDELFQTLIHRFPVVGPGERYHQMLRAVLWLAGWGHPAEKVRVLISRWLGYFQNTYEAAHADALKSLAPCVALTMAKLECGDLDYFTDHQKLSAGLSLSPVASDWLHRLVFCSPPPASTHAAGRKGQKDEESTTTWLCSPAVVAGGRYRRITPTTTNALYALLLHVQYELTTKGWAETVRLTDRQLMAIYQQVFKGPLSWKGLGKLKAEFVTRRREDGSLLMAKLKELLVLEKNGHHGVPSVYRMTGLLDAFREVRYSKGVNNVGHDAHERTPAVAAMDSKPAVRGPVRNGRRRSRPKGDRQVRHVASGGHGGDSVHDPAVPA